jgi:TolA-binding protein
MTKETSGKATMGLTKTLMIMALSLAGVVCRGEMPEVSLTDEDFKKLDSFEVVVLTKADKTFGARDFRSSLAAYDSFVQQFPKSKATPYALLRKGRCLQLDDKRFEALKVYNEVMDYFPNAVAYAGAALYFIGECHWLNGNPAEAMKAWAEMAKDVDYRKHPLAAGAINQLADNLGRQEKWKEAAEYYMQVAVDFREANRDAAYAAIVKTMDIYVSATPNEGKLREFYGKVRGFDRNPHAADDNDYWQNVMAAIDARGEFVQADLSNRETYFRYWARAMDGKFPQWDDFQIAQARYQFQGDGDEQKWMARLDRQFEAGQNPGDYSRIVKWLTAYAKNKKKMAEYYAKLSFAQMKNVQIVELIKALYEKVSIDIGRNAIPKLKADQMNDEEREKLGEWIGGRDPVGAVMVFEAMTDKPRGAIGMARIYNKANPSQPEKGLKVVVGAVGDPRYAQEAYFLKGGFHRSLGQVDEAISAYRQSDWPPKSSFCIASCLLQQGKRDQAVATLREIENFFPKEAPQASLLVAYAYRDTREKKLYIAELRGLITKYKSSSEQSQAHRELEAMGIQMGPGGLEERER